jgi:hypothetical protein
MPKDSSEEYEYFTVGLLKNSFTLEALQADAMKHHMIELPAKLIALRLTEYYDLLARSMPPVLNVSLSPIRSSGMGNGSEAIFGMKYNGHSVHNPDAGVATMPADESEEEIVVTSADAEQNADIAADYWTTL